MAAGDGNRMPEAHQFGEHLGTPDHRLAAGVRRQHFRIVGGNRAGGHHDIGIRDLPGTMADMHERAEPREPPGDS